MIWEANDVDTNKHSYQRMVVLDVNGQRLLIRSLILSAPDDSLTQTNRDKIDHAIESITFE